MKQTSFTAVITPMLTLLLFFCATILVPLRAVAGDGKQVVVERNSGVEQVVDEKHESDGKQVVVTEDAGGQQVVVKDIAAGTVAGRVFDDTNADGEKGSDESYLAAISVKLLNANDQIVAATKTNDQGIYLFQNIDSGQYELEFDFGDNKKIESQPFAVTADRSSVIVKPVPYFKGFNFDLKQAIKVHRVLTPAELTRPNWAAELSTPPTRNDSPASPFRP